MTKKLFRSERNKMLGGVCAGIAERFDLDPSLVRVAFAIFCLMAGFGILLYILMWIIVPRQSQVL